VLELVDFWLSVTRPLVIPENCGHLSFGTALTEFIAFRFDKQALWRSDGQEKR
jgi:hypothetical protein